MRIIRHSSLIPAPWRNGGGVTREVARAPLQGADFRWRLSIAQIDVPGPFSDFAGFRRSMVLLRGGGLRLTFPDGAPVELRSIGDLVEFAGAPAPQCDLLNGPCTDLNLMVADSLSGSRAWVERWAAPRPPAVARSAGTLVLVPITEGIDVTAGSAAAVRLQPWDTALFAPGEAGGFAPAGPAALVFLATLDDNGLR